MPQLVLTSLHSDLTSYNTREYFDLAKLQVLNTPHPSKADVNYCLKFPTSSQSPASQNVHKHLTNFPPSPFPSKTMAKNVVLT